ncbi:MAG: FAA hydrolase family protein [Gammaproteobacteria bacterium]|nr:FAA hydrolase family protein [Gammaproteobacteria bacterium]
MSIDKIICVGKNYLEHARELGDAIPEKPVIFLKPPSVLQQCKAWNETIQVSYPQDRGEVHHEIEIVLQVGDDAKISAVTIGLDMTLRTEQAKLKKAGHPWTTGKVFKDAAIIGPWIKMADFPQYLYNEFSLTVDDEIRQQGYGREMTMKPEDLINYIGQFFPICPGDIIFTGTPAGVGAISASSLATLKWNKYQFNVQWS